MSARPCGRVVPAGLELRLKVVPGARRDRICGPLGDRLKLQVSSPPEGGRANRAVAVLLAARFGCRPGDVVVQSGAAAPRKTVLVAGVTALPAEWAPGS